MELNLDFLILNGGCTGSSESTIVKIPHCWKSHVMAQIKMPKHVKCLPLLLLTSRSLILQFMSFLFTNNKGADQSEHPHSLIRAFVICFLDNIISKLATTKISIF